MNLTRWTRGILVLSCFAATLGCDADDQITTYQAPKDQPAPIQPLRPLTPPAAAAPVNEAGSTPLTWSVPEGWKPVEGNQMSVVTFQVSDANPQVKCTVTPLPMIPDALQANVNRWENQLGLPPTKAEDLAKVVKPVQVGDQVVNVVDLASDPNAILGAIIERDQIWFIKMTGPKDVIAGQREKFDAFVKSLKFTDQPTTAPATPQMPPQMAPQMPQMPAAPGAENRGVKWTLPGGWTEAPNPSAMRLATLKAGDAEVVASRLNSQGWGNLIDNINRWRGQIGLEPVDDPAKQPATTEDLNGAKWTTYDLAGPQKRMIVKYVTVGDSVLFFRLTGAPQAVETQKAAFDEFVKSIKFE